MESIYVIFLISLEFVVINTCLYPPNNSVYVIYQFSLNKNLIVEFSSIFFLKIVDRL
jgi:hypothetical protein